MAQFLYDTFTEASDIGLESHTPEVGGVWTVPTPANGPDVDAATGKAKGVNATSAIAYNAAVPPSADYEVSALVSRVNTTNTRPGAIARLTANNNYYYAWVGDTGVLTLSSLVAGTDTSLGTYATGWTTGPEYALKLRVQGDQLTAYWEGAAVIGPITDTNIAAAGSAGIRTRQNGRIDNLSADTLGGGGTTYTLTADAGSFSLTGQAVSLKADRRLSAATGSFTFTGQSATLTYTPAAGSYLLVAEAGSFALTGRAANLRVGRKLTAATGTYTLTGRAAGLSRGRRLTAGAGSFVLTGNAATLRAARRLTADAGAFTFTGQAATLTYAALSFAEPITIAAIARDFTAAARTRSWTAAAIARSFTSTAG